jgi:hypothetical protein
MAEKSQNSSKEAKEASHVEVRAIEWTATLEEGPTFLRGPCPHGYWTGIQLAPRLPVLLAQLTSFEDGVESFTARKANLEQLPYSLGGMCYTFFEFIRVQVELADRYSPEQGVRILPSDATNPLSYTLDAFLDQARRLANAIIFYLSARYGISLPKSMDDLVNKTLYRKPDLLPRERDLMVQYWKEHGAKVKAYRDLAQHHALLASDCRLFMGADGKPGFYLALPSNPEVKNVSKLSYEDPPINAFLYMKQVFYESIRFVHRVSICLLDPSKPPNVASLGPDIRGWIRLGSQQGVRIASADVIDAELRKLCARLAEEEGRGPV